MLKCFYILLWIAVFKLCFCQRRMGLGNESILGKKYLVYFVTSPYSETDDDTWLCAGAIVTPTQILTAAACLVEVNRIYAIAGNKKYVHGRDIDKDKCANMWKKKVVKISVPNEYATSTPKQIEWMNVDIGVATVQDPYDFNDKSYITHCSYLPESIKINFDKKYEKENTRGIALGWGGKKVKSQKEPTVDQLKPKLLQEATTTIIEKTFCANLKNGSKVLVNTYLLCASGNGFLGEEDDDTKSNSTVKERSSLSANTTKGVNESNEMSSRKSSLLETCQNDHGGPLITWIGTEEMVLGVALNGICNPNFDCVGPRIYVSTAATAKIVKCLLETNDTRRKTCNNEIDDKRYQVKDIEINWLKDIKNNSSLSKQQSPLFRRQRENEETLLVRPTKGLRNFDDHENTRDNPQEDTQYNPLENLQENQGTPRKNRLKIPQENQGQNSYSQQQNPSQVDQTQGIVNEELNNQPRKPAGYVSQQQNTESQNQPERDAFNQPQIKTQKQPQMESFNEAQMDPYNQPTLDPYYNQPPMDSIYNQRPMDSNYNQPPINSNYPPDTESYNQPQTGLYNQPPVNLNVQKPMDPYNQQDQSNPHMASQNQPQRQINTDKSNNPQISNPNPPQTEYMLSQEQSYNQPQIGSYKNPLNGLFKIPTFVKPLAEQDDEPQPETFKKTEIGLKPPPPNVEALRQAPYSNMEPRSPPDLKQTDTIKPVAVESYNPLDILMEEEDDSFKPMEEPYKTQPTELQKQPNYDPLTAQPVKSEQNKQFQQPLLSQKNRPPYRNSPQREQPNSPQHEQPNSPQHEQPNSPQQEQPNSPQHLQLNSPQHEQPNSPQHEQPNSAPGVLRGGQRIPELDPPQGDSQAFETMFSQLHAGPEAPEPPPPSKEETFDDLFSDLHDGGVEKPRDKKEAEQTGAKTMNEPQGAGILARQQMPLEYPDYTIKSSRTT